MGGGVEDQKTPFAEQVGAAAREARVRAELTQREVAERIGMATEVYGRLERGLMLPSVPTLLRLCLALGVDSNTLLGFAPAPPPAWLLASRSLPEPPAARFLVRAVRRLTLRQIELLGWTARAMVPGGARAPAARGAGHGQDDESVPR